MTPEEMLAWLNQKRLTAEDEKDKKAIPEIMQLITLLISRNNDLEECMAGIFQLSKKTRG